MTFLANLNNIMEFR